MIEALAEYAGRYTSDEVRLDAVIGIVDGHLVVGKLGRPLRGASWVAITRDTFVTDDGDFCRFDRDQRGKVHGFELGDGTPHGIHSVRR